VLTYLIQGAPTVTVQQWIKVRRKLFLVILLIYPTMWTDVKRVKLPLCMP
jgi:hypothetical protein